MAWYIGKSERTMKAKQLRPLKVIDDAKHQRIGWKNTRNAHDTRTVRQSVKRVKVQMRKKRGYNTRNTHGIKIIRQRVKGIEVRTGKTRSRLIFR